MPRLEAHDAVLVEQEHRRAFDPHRLPQSLQRREIDVLWRGGGRQRIGQRADRRA
jgi:hypothetical protein